MQNQLDELSIWMISIAKIAAPLTKEYAQSLVDIAKIGSIERLSKVLQTRPEVLVELGFLDLDIEDISRNSESLSTPTNDLVRLLHTQLISFDYFKLFFK